MRMEIPYLVPRNGRLYYRRAVSPHLRPYFKVREVKKSLGLKVGQEQMAIPLVNAEDKKFEKRVELYERAIRGSNDPHDIADQAWEWALDQKFAGPDRSGREGAGGMDGYDHTPYDQFIDEIDREAYRRIGPGRDVELSDLSPLDQAKVKTVKQNAKLKPEVTLEAAIRAYKAFTGGVLKKAEAHAFAQFEEWLKVCGDYPEYEASGVLYLKQVNKAAVTKFTRHLANARGQSEATILRRVNSLRAMWTYALDHFEADGVRNPWTRLKIASKGGASKKKTSVLPFHASHLRAIEIGLEDPSVDPELNLVVRLYRCTGCRPSEIGGLHSNDVFEDDGGVWIKIELNDVRRVKNENSERRVPVVDASVAEELLALVARKGAGPVFQKGFHEPTNLSNRGMYFLHRKCGIPKSSRLVNYSWRHTLIEALRVSGAPYDVTQALVGHSDGSVTENYGAGSVSMSRMREALEKAISVLGEVDTYHYKPEELMVPNASEGEP